MPAKTAESVTEGVDLTGQTALVTGMNSGIGQESARVVIVSSAAHQQAPKAGIEFDNLSGARNYSGWRAYGQSKLANILFANELARRVPAGTTVNSLHPGVIRTNLGRHMKGPLALAMGLVVMPFMVSIPVGAATSCFLAASPAAAGISGRYFANCAEKRPSAMAQDQQLGERLWQASAELLGLDNPAN